MKNNLCKLIYHLLLYEYYYESKNMLRIYNWLNDLIINNFNKNSIIYSYVKKYQDNILELIKPQSELERKEWKYYGTISLFKYINCNYLDMIELIETNIMNKYKET
ncbi:hypothetical protein CG710_004260 [Lachnotalea glycerini]|nr:hypothetical protein CG710_004260 [Lachnotalea glycerini]